MKKTIFYILMCLALGMAACFDDDSTLGKDFIPEIEIGELKDTAMVSYSGHVLEVTPEVNTGIRKINWPMPGTFTIPQEPPRQERLPTVIKKKKSEMEKRSGMR